MATALQTAPRAAPAIGNGGYVRRRCSRRVDGEAEAAAAEIFLRCHRAPLCSSASRNCRNIIRRAASLALLRDNAPAIASLFPPNCALIEFGSGSSKKARILFGAAATVEAYVPVDISGDFLQQDAAQLRRDFPRLGGLSGRCRFHAALRDSGRRSRRCRGSAFSRARPSAISSRMRRQNFCAMPATCLAPARS